MSCCGRNRTALRVASAPGSAVPRSPAVPLARAATQGTRLRWRRRVTAVVDGPITRTRYDVSATEPVISVDPRDAVGLLRTGFFERVS